MWRFLGRTIELLVLGKFAVFSIVRFAKYMLCSLVSLLYGINMKLKADDYNILSYLLRTSTMSYEQVINWSYNQYDDQDIDVFVEKISWASNVAEIIEMVGNTYQVYGQPPDDFLAGEAFTKYKEGRQSLYNTISCILFDLDLSLPEDELKEMYIAEDYFGWHNSAASQAMTHLEPILIKYIPVYNNAVAKFSV